MLGSRAPTGRPRRDRQSLIRPFLAKAVYNFTTTRQLPDRLRSDEQLRRLCCWDSLAAIPAESTSSRAFAAFVAAGTAERIHEAIIRNTQQNGTKAKESKATRQIQEETNQEATQEAVRSLSPHGRIKKRSID